jgi:hypothetical protein
VTCCPACGSSPGAVNAARCVDETGRSPGSDFVDLDPRLALVVDDAVDDRPDDADDADEEPDDADD